MTLGTLPNREPAIQTRVTLRTPYSGACPMSGYPLKGSWIEVRYEPKEYILELSTVAAHLPTYATEAIDVETVAQRLARDCAAVLAVPVAVEAYYLLRDGIELWSSCTAPAATNTTMI